MCNDMHWQACITNTQRLCWHWRLQKSVGRAHALRCATLYHFLRRTIMHRDTYASMIRFKPSIVNSAPSIVAGCTGLPHWIAGHRASLPLSQPSTFWRRIITQAIGVANTSDHFRELDFDRDMAIHRLIGYDDISEL